MNPVHEQERKVPLYDVVCDLQWNDSMLPEGDVQTAVDDAEWFAEF